LFFFLCFVFSQLLIIQGPYALSTIFAIVARFSIAASFSTTYLFTPEVYPTYIRATGLGFANAFSRIAGMGTPYVASYFGGDQIWVPLVIYGISCLVASVASMMLPLETSRQELK
jgi:MFS family permease